MIVVISAVIAAVASLIILRALYVNAIKVVEDEPTTFTYGVALNLVLTVMAFILVFALTLVVSLMIYDNTLDIDDYPYREEIPIENVMPDNKGKSINYIALDGTLHTTADHNRYYSESPDENIHIISLYKQDAWNSTMEYAVEILVPNYDGKSEEEIADDTRELRTSLGGEYVEVPHLQNDDKSNNSAPSNSDDDTI